MKRYLFIFAILLLLMPEFSIVAYAGSVENSSVYEREVKKILSGINPKWNQEEKVFYLHDTLVRLNSYDSSLKKHTAYNAIVDHSSVCYGYAKAFENLANRAGIKTDVIISQMMDHAWNAVCLNGKWYNIDCTNDDAAYPEEIYCSHRYFLLSDKSYDNNDGIPNDWIIERTGEKAYGRCKDTSYDNADWRNGIQNDFCYLTDGIAYFSQNDSTVYKYKCNRQKSQKIVKLSSATTDTAAIITNKGDDLYVNDDDTIYYLRKGSNKLKEIYRISDEEKQSGTLCYLNIYGNKLRYEVGYGRNDYTRNYANRCGYLDIKAPQKLTASYFEIDEKKLDIRKIGDTASFKVKSSGIKKVKWKSENNAVVTVNNGKVKAVGKGTCRITVTADNFTVNCVVRAGYDIGKKSDSTDNAGIVKRNYRDVDYYDGRGAYDEVDEAGKSEFDTSWQNDFRTYVLKEGCIYPKNYQGDATKLVIPAKAVISGKEYQTVINDTLIYPDVFSDKLDTVTELSFEKGVKFEAVKYLVKNAKKLKSLDLRGCDTSNVVENFYLAEDCPALEFVNLEGLDLSAVEGYSLCNSCDKLTKIITPKYVNLNKGLYLGGEWRTKNGKNWGLTNCQILSDAPANTAIYYFDNTIKDGLKFTVKSITYKVVNTATISPSVTVYKIKGSNAVIPENVDYKGHSYRVVGIYKNAAKNNKKLKSISIGKCVTEIGNYAFYGCANLKSIKVNSGVIYKVGKNAFGGLPSKAVMKVPMDCKDKYRSLWIGAGMKKDVVVK